MTIYISIYVYMYLYIYIYVCMYICIYVCMYVCIYPYRHKDMHASIFIKHRHIAYYYILLYIQSNGDTRRKFNFVLNETHSNAGVLLLITTANCRLSSEIFVLTALIILKLRAIHGGTLSG